MRFPFRTRLLTCFLALGMAACADSPAPQPASDAGPAVAAPAAGPTLAAATALGVPNAHEPLPHLLTAGQVSAEQLQALADAGYGTFVSLRLADEDGAGWEEDYTARNGVSFTRLPVAGAPDLTMANVEALDRILEAAGDTPTVLYCGSANRVGALLALRARWLDGATSEEALQLGRAAGMTRLEPEVVNLLEKP